MNELVERSKDIYRKSACSEDQKLKELITSKAKEFFGEYIFETGSVEVVNGKLKLIGSDIELKLSSKEVTGTKGREIEGKMYHFLIDIPYSLGPTSPNGIPISNVDNSAKARQIKITDLRSLGEAIFHLESANFNI